jgi:hypothetical protein
MSIASMLTFIRVLGTFYVLLVMAAVGLKTHLLSRDVTRNFLIDSLAFALRNPESVFLFA